jgi:hypothetical protein
MNEWVWQICGMILKGENPIPVPFFPPHPIWDLELNQGLHGERLVNDHQCHVVAVLGKDK